MLAKRQTRPHCSRSTPDLTGASHDRDGRTPKSLLMLDDTSIFDLTPDASSSDIDFDNALREFFHSYFEDGNLDLDAFVEAHAAMSKVTGDNPDKMKAVAAFMDFNRKGPPLESVRAWVLQVLATKKISQPSSAVRVLRWCARQEGTKALRSEAFDRRRIRKVEERTKRREESLRVGRLHLEMRRKEVVEGVLQKDREKRDLFTLKVAELRHRDLLHRARVLGLPNGLRLPSSASLQVPVRPPSRADSSRLPERAVTAPGPAGPRMELGPSLHFPPPPISIPEDPDTAL